MFDAGEHDRHPRPTARDIASPTSGTAAEDAAPHTGPLAEASPPALDPGPASGPAPEPAPGDDRPLKPALWRGWRRRCPNCGAGPLMKGYLAVRDACPVCDEPLHHQRADDGPAYLTILIVGHVLAPVLLWAFTEFRPDPFVLASVFSVTALAMSLYLLPRLKGAMIAFQWSRRMHGFR